MIASAHSLKNLNLKTKKKANAMWLWREGPENNSSVSSNKTFSGGFAKNSVSELFFNGLKKRTTNAYEFQSFHDIHLGDGGWMSRHVWNLKRTDTTLPTVRYTLLDIGRLYMFPGSCH
jgi:hypothetical protein